MMRFDHSFCLYWLWNKLGSDKWISIIQANYEYVKYLWAKDTEHFESSKKKEQQLQETKSPQLIFKQQWSCA